MIDDVAAFANKAQGTAAGEDMTAALLLAFAATGSEKKPAPKQEKPDLETKQAPSKSIGEAAFNNADANGDGAVSREEFNDFMGAPSPKPRADGSQTKALDTNGDGKVSMDELRKALDIDGDGAVTADEITGAMDADGDGKVTADELLMFLNKGGLDADDEEPSAAPHGGGKGGGAGKGGAGKGAAAGEAKPLNADKNDDGTVSLDELKDAVDTNKDGMVTQDELTEALDANEDGKISADEVLDAINPEKTSAKAPTPPAPAQDQDATDFDSIDTNGDGELSEEEFLNAI